jgi:hypothetical protein
MKIEDPWRNEFWSVLMAGCSQSWWIKMVEWAGRVENRANKRRGKEREGR